MRLEDKYYRIVQCKTDSSEAAPDEASATMSGTFDVELQPDCEVYLGHFPGNPVCPGVCNIGMIRECTEHLTRQQELHISSIRQCRLTALATPSACPRLKVEVNATPDSNGYSVTARISDTSNVYMEYKGEMTAEE